MPRYSSLGLFSSGFCGEQEAASVRSDEQIVNISRSEQRGMLLSPPWG